MRIAFLTPLPPNPSGVSDYSAELIPVLAQHIDVHAYTEPQAAAEQHKLAEKVIIRSYDEFPRHHTDYHAVFCHVGGGAEVSGPYQMLMRYSGIAVLHDLNLSGLFGSLTFGQGKGKRFLWEVYRNEGMSAFLRVTYRFLRTRCMPDPHELWMNRRVIRRSQGIVVHSAYARRKVEETIVQRKIPVWQVPMGVPSQPAITAMDVQEAKRDLRVDQYSFVVGFFGFIHEGKRFSAVVESFRRFLCELPNALLLFVGPYEPEHKRSAEDSIGKNYVRFTGYVDIQSFYRYIQATDFCVNLRYPASGEASASLLRIMSVGKPVAVSDHVQFTELPEDVCVKVRVGNEETELLQGMLRMATSSQLRRQLSECARQYICREHTLARAAQGYVRMLEEFVSSR